MSTKRQVDRELEVSEFDSFPIVHRVIGAPGTGKTTRVVGNPNLNIDGLFIENGEDYNLDEQMLVTYTNAGVDEAKERLSKMLDAPKYKIDERVTTIHSQCYSLLNDDPRFPGLERKQVVDHYNKRNFCKKHDLEYGWEDDEDDIMGADMDEGNALFRIYSWLQNNLKDLSEWEDCPADWTWDKDPEYLMEQWEEYKENNGLVGFGDMIEGVLALGYKDLKDKGLGILFPDENTTYQEMFKAARNDPERDPDKLRGSGVFIDTKVLYVDEVQDLTTLQHRWYLLQKLVAEKVYIGGDDDQCLLPNAPVEVRPNPLQAICENPEMEQKPIKDVTVGEQVRTMMSDGEVGYKTVTNVKKKEANDETFRLIKTESGNRTAVTANHKMFTHLPPAKYEPVTDKYYVYLMRDNSGRWRIGETEDLRQRMNVERGARCIIPLDSFESKEEALLKESQWSLNYSVPQVNIQEREGQVIENNPDYRERLYNNIQPSYNRLEKDFDIDLSKPPFFKKAVNRGRTSSVNINIKMCHDTRNGILHRIMVYTSDSEAQEKLLDIEELTESDGKNDAMRYRYSSSDIRKIGKVAEKVKKEIGGDIITNMSPTEDRKKAIVTPAGNLAEGMIIPVVKDDEVQWEEIVEIEEQTGTTEVYDLEVEDTHNFTTNGIGVHNTIYGWSGADPKYMLDEEGEMEVLETTYRIPREIWEVCNGVIQQVDKRQHKEVQPNGEGGEFITKRVPSGRQLVELLREGEWMVLFRARYQIDEFCNETLSEYGIPYRNMSTFDIWDDDLVKLRDALAKIENGASSIKGDELHIMMEYAEDDMLLHDSGVSNKEKVMGQFGGISRDRLEEIFQLKDGYREVSLSAKNFVQQTEELNYYEKQALIGNIKSGNTDMQPDRIRIGTIHSAKGKEAPNVLLATDSTQTILENMALDLDDIHAGTEKGNMTDAERRVYYVGMTRASERLVLAQGVINPEQVIDINCLLAEDHESDRWESSRSIE